MFEPILARIGTLGVGALFLVIVCVALAPAVWDLLARTLALPVWRDGAICRLREHLLARILALPVWRDGAICQLRHKGIAALALVRRRLGRLTLGGLVVTGELLD